LSLFGLIFDTFLKMRTQCGDRHNVFPNIYHTFVAVNLQLWQRPIFISEKPLTTQENRRLVCDYMFLVMFVSGWVQVFGLTAKYLSAHKLSEPRRKNFKVIIRCLRRFEFFKRKEDHKGFKLSFASLSLDVLHQIEDFLGNEKDAFLKYPEIYEEFPYSAKVAVKTPKRKLPSPLDKEGSVVPKGMPKPCG